MIFNYNSSELRSKLELDFSKLKKESIIQTICMFDLTGSTKLKSMYGHKYGTNKALKTIFLTRHIIQEFNGQIVKELGDGILCRFNDPVQACLAGLAVKESALSFNIKIRGAITVGMVELLQIDNNIDTYGIAVDRCSRISSFALPSQIIIDRPMLEVVKSYLTDFKNIEIGKVMKRILKGIGETELFEISTSELGLKKYMHIPLRIHEDGRVPLSDKIYFVKDANKEVIEMGLGLTTFSKWFSGHKPSEFRDYIQNLLVKGVNFNLLAIDPDWDGTHSYFQDFGNPEYIEDIQRSLDYLIKEQRRLLNMGLPGEFKIFLYQFPPTMHMLCVDHEDEMNGRVFISSYLFNTSRSECPVFEFSYLSNRVLFEKYINSLKSIMKHKSRLLE